MIHAYADFMYNTGLLDTKQRDYFSAKVDVISSAIQQKNWTKAFQVQSLQCVSGTKRTMRFRRNVVLKFFYAVVILCSGEEFHF